MKDKNKREMYEKHFAIACQLKTISRTVLCLLMPKVVVMIIFRS